MNKLALSLDEIRLQLSGLELFQLLPGDALDSLCSEVEAFGVEGGEYLLRKEDPADCMYVVANGRLRVITNPIRGKVLAELGKGQTIGEMALISEEPRMAFVQACRHSQVLRLSKERFDRLIIQWPEVLLKISQFLVDRLKKTGVATKKKTVIKTVTLVPVCRIAVFSEFSERLAKQLKREGQELSLSSRTLNQREISGSGSTWDAQNLSTSFIKIINDKESEFRFIVFKADATLTSWTKFCLRQADRILLIAAVEDSSELNEIETFIFGSSEFERTAAIELCLLHRSAIDENEPVGSEKTKGDWTSPEQQLKKIGGTKSWLNKRPVFRHHHLLFGHMPHYERAARFLSGKAVGLVIGGGAARGGGALGVIKALKEKDIPIDMVGGTSIGSTISGLMAIGYNLETILKKLMTMVESVNKSSFLTLPVLGLAGKKVMEKMFANLFEDQYMEDLWINCFTISTNLSTGGTMVHRTGLLREACRASGSLPGLSEPVIRDGDILVDGALVDNLPTDVMSDLCEGFVILINILPEEGFVMESQSMPSAGKFLANKLNPFSKSPKALTIVDILMRAFTISNYSDLKKAQSLADLNLKPPVQDYGFFNPKVYEKTMKIGYDYVKNKLKDFKWDEDL